MKGKILIVDDEESIRFTFETFLVEEGHTVFTARSHEEALAVMTATDLDLIFTDIILEGKTGIDVLRAARQRGLSCPVVIITGYPDVETAAEAVRLGAFDYIPKPVLQDALLHTTGTALRHKEVVEEGQRCRSNLDAIFRSVKDGIVTVDEELRAIEVNEAAWDICGLSRDFIGKEMGSPRLSCRGTCLRALKKAIEEKRIVEEYRLECRRDGNLSQIVNVSIYPLLDRRSEFSGAVMVVRDETHVAGLEQNLDERRQFHNIVGKSRDMQQVFSLLETLSDVQTTVLITGESGTGKELAAQALHCGGSRSRKPFVKVNCSALSDGLLESELFGHVKGAFTGALQDKAGRFQRADGGTLFLDEIGDISSKMQSSLLRVLQESEFERVGDSTTVKVDVRVIAATNQDLRAKVSRGEFREDLFYRLKVVELHISPLRERPEDILLLADHFLKKFQRKFNKRITGLSSDVRDAFLQYPWPGNVRELEHAIEHGFVICRQDTITMSHLPPELWSFRQALEGKGLDPVEPGEPGDPGAILEALRRTAGNKAKAARLLGMSRRTLYRKLGEYHLGDGVASHWA